MPPSHGAPPLPPHGSREIEPIAPALIEVRGDHFAIGGRRVVPHGVNSYPLLQHVGEGRWEAVDDVLEQAVELGRPIVRTNAFMDGGRNPARLRDDDGTLREAGLCALDALLARAARAGVRLLLTLANNWSDHGGAPAVVRAIAAGAPLPKDAFWSDPRALDLQLKLIRALATRKNTVSGSAYRDDAAIFAWELVNEARCTEPGWCGPDTLTAWARTMAGAIRAAGARQPIAWGGSGYRGRYGEDLDSLARDGAVDVLTLHLYPGLPSPLREAAPRALRIAAACARGAAAIHDRAALARRYRMPLLLEELGYLPPAHVQGPERDAERAEVLGPLLALAAEHGIATFPWMIGERGRVDHDGHLLRPEHARTRAVLLAALRA